MRSRLEAETFRIALTAASSSNDLESGRPVNADADRVNIGDGSEGPLDFHKKSIAEALTRTTPPSGLVPSETVASSELEEYGDSG